MKQRPSHQYFENISIERTPQHTRFSNERNVLVYEFQEKVEAPKTEVKTKTKTEPKTEEQFLEQQQEKGLCVSLCLRKNEQMPALDTKLPHLLFPKVTDRKPRLGIPCTLYSQDETEGETELLFVFPGSCGRTRGYKLETLSSLRACNLLSPLAPRNSRDSMTDPMTDSGEGPAMTSYVAPEDASTLLSLRPAHRHALFVHDSFSAESWEEFIALHPAQTISISEKFLKDFKRLADPSLKTHVVHSLENVLCAVGACRACAKVQETRVYTICKQGVLQENV